MRCRQGEGAEKTGTACRASTGKVQIEERAYLMPAVVGSEKLG